MNIVNVVDATVLNVVMSVVYFDQAAWSAIELDNQETTDSTYNAFLVPILSMPWIEFNSTGRHSDDKSILNMKPTSLNLDIAEDALIGDSTS